MHLILLYMSQIRELLPPFSQMSYSSERHAIDFSRHEASAERLPMLSMFCTSLMVDVKDDYRRRCFTTLCNHLGVDA